MKKVLIIVSSFKPAIIADMHRARMLSFHLPNFGWQIEVMTPDKSYQPPDIIEENSSFFFPSDLIIHSVPEWHNFFLKSIGIGSIGWRAFWPMFKLGSQLLRKGEYDLVYISTTNFVLFCLGRLWNIMHGIPYVLDFHDPWFKENYQYITTKNALKWKTTRLLSKYLERFSIKKAAAVVSVSPQYLHTIINRYKKLNLPWIINEKYKVIPFGAMEKECNSGLISNSSVKSNKSGYTVNAVYVGAGGAFMAKSFSLFCQGLKILREKEPELVGRLKISLFGTYFGWKKGDEKILQEIADKSELSHIIQEQPSRVSYQESIQLAEDADGLLVLGVDDPGYFPSKLISYALLGKPLLASFHYSSPAASIFTQYPDMGNLICFDGTIIPDKKMIATIKNFILEMVNKNSFDRRTHLKPFLASAMAEKHASLFNSCTLPPPRRQV
ncbi:MAG: glycosyltransferase [Deltaproteobacteria bacterium]|nr:glycosyltransferase [Deltaproteobacteria bacterium]